MHDKRTEKPRFVGEKVRLGDVLEKTFSGEWGVEEGELLTPVLRTSNFNEDGTFDYETPAMRCIPAKKIEAKRMLRGDIVLEKSGGTPKRPVGIMAYYDSDDLALCSNFNQVLRFDKGVVDSKYAFYQLRWLKERGAFRQFTRKTTGLQNLQMKKFVDLKLLRPPLEEQKKISSQFDAIAAQIAHAEVQIEKFDQLVKSRFVEMFGLYVKDGDFSELSELCEFVTVGIANAATHAYSDDGVVMLRNLNVRENKLDDSDLIRIKPEFAAKYAKKSLKTGDVLVTRTGYPGIACVVPEKYSGCQTFTTLIARLKDDAPVIPLFLSYWINSPSGKEFVARMKAGSSQQNFGATSLKLMPVPLPSLELQQEFAAFVSQVDKPRFAIQQQIEKLETLKASLMQEYFG